MTNPVVGTPGNAVYAASVIHPSIFNVEDGKSTAATLPALFAVADVINAAIASAWQK